MPDSPISSGSPPTHKCREAAMADRPEFQLDSDFLIRDGDMDWSRELVSEPDYQTMVWVRD